MSCRKRPSSAAMEACTLSDSTTTFSLGAFSESNRAGSSRSRLSITCQEGQEMVFPSCHAIEMPHQVVASFAHIVMDGHNLMVMKA